MEKELKTLEDLKCIRDETYFCCDGNKQDHNYIPSRPWTDDGDLRQLAIKWYKSKEIITMNKYDFIKYFFNISQEDLK